MKTTTCYQILATRSNMTEYMKRNIYMKLFTGKKLQIASLLQVALSL